MSAPDTTYSILFDVYVLGQKVRKLLNEAMEPGPLRPEEYAVYSVVFEEESVTPTRMSEELSLPYTTVMDFIKLMEGRGHSRRLPNPRDRRSYLVVLTASGMQAHREANRLFEEAYQRFVAALPQGEEFVAEQLRQTLSAADRAIKAASYPRERAH